MNISKVDGMQIEKYNQTDSRDSFLDFVKGISIILVLWGHCIQYLSVESFDFFDDSAFKIIYSFHT